ncbi:hypothetical protein MKW92_015441 [Papaver armeniacum]|nr:hypothetical protein MKW92_015441 [Papaver armeniacum]
MESTQKTIFFCLFYIVFLFIILETSEAITSEKPNHDKAQSLTLSLHPIDSLLYTTYPKLSPESLFKLKLQKDRIKIQSLSNIMALESSNNDGNDDYNFDFPVAPGPYWKLPRPSLLFEYFTVLRIGTSPATEYVLLMDTGSSLTWIQCLPCNTCYDQLSPIFDPNRSETYSVKDCNQHISLCDGCNDRKECTYSYIYGDGSYSHGLISDEVYTVSEHMMNLTIGCGHNNSGTFNSSDGILGLGRGEFSFPSQIDRKYGFKKFSYCLVDKPLKEQPFVSSSIRFGNDVLDQPNDVVYTPIIPNPKFPDQYYINLTSISVAGKLIPVHPLLPNGIVVDSGTSLSWFPASVYEAVRDSFRDAALQLEVILHFGGDDEAAVELKAENVLFNYPWIDANVYCLAFGPSLYKGLAILGNVQQQGIRVVFDNVASVIGFDPNSC